MQRHTSMHKSSAHLGLLAELPITTDDIIHLAPGDPHALLAIEPSYLYLVMVDADAGARP